VLGSAITIGITGHIPVLTLDYYRQPKSSVPAYISL